MDERRLSITHTGRPSCGSIILGRREPVSLSTMLTGSRVASADMARGSRDKFGNTTRWSNDSLMTGENRLLTGDDDWMKDGIPGAGLGDSVNAPCD